MIVKRPNQKKLSIQISASEKLDSEDPDKHSLTPSHLSLNNTSESESELAIKSIINPNCDPKYPELSSPIKLIQANTKAKQKFQQTKKNLLKMKLVQRLKQENFSKVSINSTNKTACTLQDTPLEPNHINDDSLVNLESVDESTYKQNW
jgi:hypothetical protein